MGLRSAWLSTGIDTGTCIRCCNSENLNFCLQSNVIYMYIPLISPDKVKIYHCLQATSTSQADAESERKTSFLADNSHGCHVFFPMHFVSQTLWALIMIAYNA